MKVFLALLALILGGLYYFTGFRIGVIPNTSLYAFNAQATSVYPFQLYGEGQITITGSCQVSSGSATVNFVTPDNVPVTTPVECVKGKWSLNMTTRGQPGFYKVNVKYKHFTGVLTLTPEAKTKL